MRSNARISVIALLVLCSVLAIIISGCNADGASFISSRSASADSGPASSGTSTPTTLAWEAPATFNDGVTFIETGDIKGYRIYIYSDADLTVKFAEYLVTGPTTSIHLMDLNNAVFPEELSQRPSATYYLAVTAIVSVNGVETESSPSNSVRYSYP